MFSFDFTNESLTKYKTLIKMMISVLLLSLTVGYLVHLIEPTSFPNMFDGVWWSLVTISTVGYGDFTPESVLARLLAILLIVAGITLFSFFITHLASSTILSKQEREQGNMPYKKQDHYIVIGWNERSKVLIKELQQSDPHANIVLIDHSLEKIPENMKPLVFIRGDVTADETFKRANINAAHTVIITADLHINENIADSNSVLTLLTVKGMKSTIYAIIELISPRQEKNAKRAGADEVILSSNYLSLLMMNGIHSHGMTNVIVEILKQKEMNHLQLEEIPTSLLGEDFKQAILEYQTEDAFLLGLFRDGKTLLYPKKNARIMIGDKFILFKRGEV